MKVQAYLSFGGRCEEALAFYKTSIGAEVTSLMRWRDSPDTGMKSPPGDEEKIMNAAFRIGETELMADDGMGQTRRVQGDDTCDQGGRRRRSQTRLHSTRSGRQCHDAPDENVLDLVIRHADRQIRRALDGQCGGRKGVSLPPP